LGRIAEQEANRPEPSLEPKPNKLDRILAKLDDEDLALVMSWLHDVDMGEEEIELRLLAADVEVSDTTIRRWRKLRGIRGEWAA
jgi:hypothetical protein